MVRKCNNCETNETKCWRNINNLFYCNPCALYFKRNQKHKEVKDKTNKVTEHEFDSFECQECNKIYNQICSLRKHCKNTHSGKGAEDYSKVIAKTFSSTLDFQCPICEVCCKSHFGLKRHMTKNHEEKENLKLFHQIPLFCLKENSDLLKKENFEELMVSYVKKRIEEIKFYGNFDFKINSKWNLNEINKIYQFLKIKEKNNFEEILNNLKTKNLKEVLNYSLNVYEEILNLLQFQKKRKFEFDLTESFETKNLFLDEFEKFFNQETFSFEPFEFEIFDEVSF